MEQRKNRYLDGVFMIINRDGCNVPVCLSDMTTEELEEAIGGKSAEWLRSAVVHLAESLRDIGDQFDIFKMLD